MTPQQLHDIGADHQMRLRGSVLVVATTIEAILMLIVYYSNVKQYRKAHKSPSLKLKNLTFGGKIKRTKDLISEHHPDLAGKYIYMSSLTLETNFRITQYFG